MLEVESTVSSGSMWESMVSWLTPAVLFLLLNLTIATIALSSSLSSNKPTNGSDLSQSPPSVLQRLRSLNLSPFRSQPSISQTHIEQNQQQQRSLDEVFSQMEVCHVSKTTSDPSHKKLPHKNLPDKKLPDKNLPERMKKSASMKSSFGQADDVAASAEARRPATVRERKADADVDAKADDFINRFKNQLKLQRMDSIVRYKEMVGRGGAN